MKTKKWIPAINRLKIVIERYDRTVFIKEALHRLVEVYYRIGLIEEAKNQGCYKLICTSRNSKPRVHSLYEKIGFKDWGKEFRIDF